MTLQAGNILVFPAQWPVGLFTVVEASLVPAAGVMAAGALAAVPAAVDVAAAMAGNTLRRRLVVFHTVKMTGLAGAILMLPGQSKVSFCSVVKRRSAPVILGMTALTVLSVTAQVHIPQLVTANATAVVKTVLLTGMAAAALQFAMAALQRKIRIVVIKGRGFVPAVGRMAIGALLSQRAAMLVLLLVACMAAAIGLAKFRPCLVTAATGGADMFPRQREIGVLVLENIQVQAHDVVVPSLVIGMAALAAEATGHGRESVKPLFLLTISGHFLVAVKAQGILGGFVKTTVAAVADWFLFCMSLCQRTRHQDH